MNASITTTRRLTDSAYCIISRTHVDEETMQSFRMMLEPIWGYPDDKPRFYIRHVSAGKYSIEGEGYRLSSSNAIQVAESVRQHKEAVLRKLNGQKVEYRFFDSNGVLIHRDSAVTPEILRSVYGIPVRKPARIWRAYVNEGIELSGLSGCATKAEAIELCRQDRAYIMAHSPDGSDRGFVYHIEQLEEAGATTHILANIILRFKK